MNLEIFTLALDSMPFITWHLPVFDRLPMPWRWTIVEGAAMNVNCTKWCQPQEPRLSRDGTTEYLNSIRRHPRVRVIQQQQWEGKVEMCNAALEGINRESVILQVDCDEAWESWQLERIYNLMTPHMSDVLQFRCVYYVGPNIVTTGENSYGANRGEWDRAFYFTPGQKWVSHEPPLLGGTPKHLLSRDVTAKWGLVFRHFAYYFESQVAYKEKFYGYTDALKKWRRLQENRVWPVKLKDYLDWVDENATANLLWNT